MFCLIRCHKVSKLFAALRPPRTHITIDGFLSSSRDMASQVLTKTDRFIRTEKNEITYLEYLDTLSARDLSKSRNSIVVNHCHADERLQYWKEIAHKLFPAHYGFRVRLESLSVSHKDVVYGRLFNWPLKYVAIGKSDIRRQVFGIIWSHDLVPYLEGDARIKKSLSTTSNLGIILRHMGRIGRRAHWIQTYGCGFFCAEHQEGFFPRLLHGCCDIRNQDSVGVLQVVARNIADQSSEQLLFLRVPTKVPGEYLVVPVK